MRSLLVTIAFEAMHQCQFETEVLGNYAFGVLVDQVIQERLLSFFVNDQSF